MDFDNIPDEVKCNEMADMHYELFEKFGRADVEPSVQMIRAWMKLNYDSFLANVTNN